MKKYKPQKAQEAQKAKDSHADLLLRILCLFVAVRL